MPSEEILRLLPDVDALRRKAQALAMMDAIMSLDWKYRYFLFNANWAPGEMMAKIDNGCGDDLYLLFNSAGAILKGFDHESDMSPWRTAPNTLWPRLFKTVPPEFAEFLTEPAFSIENSTFCIWRRYNDVAWHTDDIEYPDGDEAADGSGWLLQEYAEGPQTYVDFCKEYYEREVPLEIVSNFYNLLPLNEENVAQLNPEITISLLKQDIDEIAYPVGL
jgi:hypothetical protein